MWHIAALGIIGVMNVPATICHILIACRVDDNLQREAAD